MGRKSKIEARAIHIFRYISRNPDTYLTAISESLGINTFAVHKCLGVLDPFIEKKNMNDYANISLPVLPILIRIREGATEDKVINWLRNKRSLEKSIG